MRAVDTVGTANRDADGVNGDRIVPRQVGEEFRGVRIGQEVLGMHFKASDRRTRVHYFGEMGKPETDASGVGSAVDGHGHVQFPIHAFGFKLPPTMRSQ